MPLFRSETVPPDCFCVVLGDTFVRCRTSNPGCTARTHAPVPQRDGTTGLPLRQSWGTPSSVSYIQPRLHCASHPPVPQRDGTTGLPLRRPWGTPSSVCRTSHPGCTARRIPCSAARRYHRTASASSWGTPRPVSYINPGWSARAHAPVPRAVSTHAVRSHSRPCCMRPIPFGSRRQLLYPRLHLEPQPCSAWG